MVGDVLSHGIQLLFDSPYRTYCKNKTKCLKVLREKKQKRSLKILFIGVLLISCILQQF